MKLDRIHENQLSTVVQLSQHTTLKNMYFSTLDVTAGKSTRSYSVFYWLNLLNSNCFNCCGLFRTRAAITWCYR
eukprot:UN00721